MKTRVISGTILGIILAALIIIGGVPLLVGSMLVGLQGCYELYKVGGISRKPYTYISYPLIIGIYYLIFKGYFNAVGIPLTIFLVVASCSLIYLSVHVIVFPGFKIDTRSLGLLGLLYPGLMSSCLYLCRIKDDGLFYAALIIVASLCTDVFAYFTGIKFGKSHPFKLLSPKKTIEGCIGGIVGACIVSAILAMIFNKNIFMVCIISIVGSIFSMLGDLSASSIKREHEIKDYSFIIPGHGGIMDRFDSTFFVGAIVLICVTLLF